MTTPIAPLALPTLAPLRARLLNALSSRALPCQVLLDAGTETPPVCQLSLNGVAAAQTHEAPAAPAASLFLRSGEALWRLDWSSLEALALRPELDAWRCARPVNAQDFVFLPQELCLAVLERLLTPALAQLEALLGCEVRCTAAPSADIAWQGALPFVLRLPQGETIFLRLSWADDAAARMLLEQLEQLPLHTVPPRPAEKVACRLEAGSMRLSVAEAADLGVGDVLLPETWAGETPRLRLPGGRAVVCRREDGLLTILGPDAGQDGEAHVQRESEETMSDEQTTPPVPETTAQDAAAAPLWDTTAIGSLELPVVFELGSLHLRLDELAALTPGYTFALGGSASSPLVDIRVGGRVLAQGRLVDVGGMPGVQITRMQPDGAGEPGAAPAAEATDTPETAPAQQPADAPTQEPQEDGDGTGRD